MHNSVNYHSGKSLMLRQKLFLVAVLCGCRGDLAFLADHQIFLFILTFGAILEDLLPLGSKLRPFLIREIALCVSNIYTIEYILTITSLRLSYISAKNVGLPTTTTCMRYWLTIREYLSNLCTKVSRSFIEVGTVLKCIRCW